MADEYYQSSHTGTAIDNAVDLKVGYVESYDQLPASATSPNQLYIVHREDRLYDSLVHYDASTGKWVEIASDVISSAVGSNVTLSGNPGTAAEYLRRIEVDGESRKVLDAQLGNIVPGDNNRKILILS